MKLRPFAPEESARWDAFCCEAHQATFLHSRKYLSYHGERFRDRSLLIEDDRGRLIGLFPAAVHPSDGTCVVSHPGITYGGVLHDGSLKGERMIEALSAIARRYADEGAQRLLLKTVPPIYHRVPSQDDIYALFRLHALRVRCDLSSAIDLSRRLPVSRRRRRSLAKSTRAGVQIINDRTNLPALWRILEENLARKYGVRPVHSIDEIMLLFERFPDELACVCALLDDKIVAGVVLFRMPMVCHAQYIACSEIGSAVSALDATFEHCIVECSTAENRWFDFGISTTEDGGVLNEGLYQFKSEFGGGGVVYEFYELQFRGHPWIK